ncbi:MAG: hypothetical protein H0T51_20435 [Pirellulales bacterium]|nr:hypothetical protein [Pirellulales bacterium]
MAVCALFLGRASLVGPIGLRDSPLHAFAIALTGAAIAAVLVVANACRNGFPWRSTDPGHWLALVAAWEFLEGALVRRFLIFATGGVDGNNVPHVSHQMLDAINSVAYAGIAAILLVGVVSTNWPIYWRIALAIHILDATNAVIWRLTADAAHWLHMPDAIYLQSLPFMGTLAGISLIVATAIDLYRKQFRNWPHWIGLLYALFHWYVIVTVYMK